MRSSSDVNMILSYRGDQSQQTNRVFDGLGDVHMFFFYFENMVMGEKKDEEKLIELIGHLDGEAFQLFFDKFIDNGKLNDAAKDFEKVQTVFLEEFAREEEPQEVITRAPEARLDSSNLTKYLADIEKLYG